MIAANKPLDFSFLKVPEGRMFAGAEAAELKKVLTVGCDTLKLIS